MSQAAVEKCDCVMQIICFTMGQIFAYVKNVQGQSEKPANFCPVVKPASSSLILFCAIPAFKVTIYHEKPLFLHRSRAQGTPLKVLGFQELHDSFLRSKL